MKNKHTKKIVQASLALGILFISVMPVSMAIEYIPPEITNIEVTPQVVIQANWMSFYVYCTIVEDSTIYDVALRITGPGTDWNLSMNLDMANPPYYAYYKYLEEQPGIGTYNVSIWALDRWGNTNTSDTYSFIVIAEQMSYVHVDDSNTAGPWDGTEAHPFPTILMGRYAVSPYGTEYIHAGLYRERVTMGSMNLIGEDEDTVIIDALGLEYGIRIGSSTLVVNATVSHITICNSSSYGIMPEAASASHITISYTNIRDNPRGIYMTTFTTISIINCDIFNNNIGIKFLSDSQAARNKIIIGCNIHHNSIGIEAYRISNNSFYHNNFFNNTKNEHITSYATSNYWDNGTTGNYWADYQQRYPNASIIPSTGTWDTPYQINTTNTYNYDNHPWVYPNGYVDAIPPSVTVTSPNGGETLAGEITITWTATDDLTDDLDGTVGISYSADAGVSWQNIASGLDNTGSYAWDTTTVANGADYLIKVEASDEFLNIGSDASDEVFTINNNQIPGIPTQPVGSTSGFVDVEYTYTTSATDPDDDQVYYKWSWGTEESDWLGPYDSGETVTASHIWTAVGTYDVKVKAKDTSDVESDWSTVLPVTITETPELVIDTITGGFGITAVIRNNGSVDATNVTWSIVLNGGFIIRGSNVTDIIDSIPAGEEAIISSGLILGLGRTTITVSATCNEGVSAEKTASGFVLLFFVLGVQ